MALIDPQQTVQIEIPHEPGEWVQFKPITIGDVIAVQKKYGGRGEMSAAEINVLTMVECGIQEWSYQAPISEESVLRLDRITYNWLSTQLLNISGQRSEEEKKDSGLSSSPTEVPAGDTSPASSAT